MKIKFFAALCCAVLMATVGIADEPKSTTCKCACPYSSSVDKGIVAAVDLYIIVKYGVRIPDVALAVQENVKQAIETMTGLTVVEVNIHVQGVGVPEEEPKEEEAARVR